MSEHLASDLNSSDISASSKLALSRRDLKSSMRAPAPESSPANLVAAARDSDTPPSHSIIFAMAEDFSAISLAISASLYFSSSSAMFSSVGFAESIADICALRNSISSGSRLFADRIFSISRNMPALSSSKLKYASDKFCIPANESSIESWLRKEKSFWGSPGPWKSIQ